MVRQVYKDICRGGFEDSKDGACEDVPVHSL